LSRGRPGPRIQTAGVVRLAPQVAVGYQLYTGFILL